MKVKYTNEQWQAVTESGCNILVSAAAGSGKTAVLTERIVQKIIDKENPKDINSLLIVTFTDAATSEMRQRISAKLEEALINTEEKDPLLAAHISKQITLLNKSYISTIDSFCLNTVRQNFNLLDIDPNFRIIDNSENDIIKEEILDELLEELYEKNEKDFINFINFFSDNYPKNTDSNAKKYILGIYTIMQNMPNPFEWLNISTENFNLNDKENFFKTKWAKFITDKIISSFNKINSYNEKILNLLYSHPEKSEKFIVSFEDFKLYLIKCEKILKEDFKNLEFLLNKKFKLINSRTSINSDIKDSVLELKKDLSEELNKFYVFLNYFSDKSFEMTKNTYPIIRTLQDIIKEFSKRLFNIKKEKSIFSFNDISHLALEALSDNKGKPSNTAIEFQNKFDEIILDEYQDISELQEAILSLISRKNELSNRFMVGDIKQCIYGFRFANPYLFAKKYEIYTTDFSKAKNDGYRIDLSKNFRSRECILSAINFIFKQIMTKEFSGIEYDKNAMLYYGADFPPQPEGVNIAELVEFELINSDKIQNDENTINPNLYDEKDDFENDDLNNLMNTELELSLIANKIEYMINTEKLHIYDKDLKKYRPVQYKDIVIMSFSVKDISIIIQDIFTRKKIPFSTKTKGNFFDSLEVAIALSFLSVIDNPYQDIELFTVLHSPVYSFTFAELSKIKILLPEKYFYSALLRYITPENKNREAVIVKKINIFLADFEKWKNISLNSTINELLQTIYDDTDYYNYVGILSNGNLRRENLKVLQEKAVKFEKTNSKGLFKFIKYVEKIKKTDFNENETISQDERNAVIVTNIHQSKGLEYPVLFLCGLSKKFNFDSSSSPADKDFGIGIKFKDIENNIKFNTISQRSIYMKHKEEIIAEAIRLLYVALTRAREKLILVGNIKNFEKTMYRLLKNSNTSDKQFSYDFIENIKSFMEIIVSSLARHKAGEPLREFYDKEYIINEELYNDCSQWKINITNRSLLNISEKQSSEQKKQLYSELLNLDVSKDYSGLKKEIERRLNWVYPNCEIKNIPIITSISEIKRKMYESEEYIPTTLPSPNFTKEYIGLSSAQKGTAVHTLLEHIDFNINYDLEKIKKHIEQLVKINILSKQESESINTKKILTFLSSEIVKRIKLSDSVYKETPFVMGLSPYEILGNEYININADDNNILVHGIIDLYFEENNNLILLDYKTDYIENNNINEILDKYKIQINLYKKALELSTGKKVSEAGLYLFGINSYVTLIRDEIIKE